MNEWTADEIAVKDGVVYVGAGNSGGVWIRVCEGHYTCEVEVPSAAVDALVKALEARREELG